MNTQADYKALARAIKDLGESKVLGPWMTKVQEAVLQNIKQGNLQCVKEPLDLLEQTRQACDRKIADAEERASDIVYDARQLDKEIREEVRGLAAEVVKMGERLTLLSTEVVE